ncbi:hypothetical protein EST38_g5646 [Candolleomyces aberdarensis]|uniref:Uncharacterized protein n=1 Tax=Candolleomyces aberdarensis TaxID=2316362 RepID=A0A4Q2DLZ1_9AGAR|nr:hypothetical protein EST38_g5646 [Candolleomyces aberdarensis]
MLELSLDLDRGREFHSLINFEPPPMNHGKTSLNSQTTVWIHAQVEVEFNSD